MISLDECKQVLGKSGNYYSDNDLKILRNVLYSLAEIEYNHFRGKMNYESQNNNLHQGFN